MGNMSVGPDVALVLAVASVLCNTLFFGFCIKQLDSLVRLGQLGRDVCVVPANEGEVHSRITN